MRALALTLVLLATASAYQKPKIIFWNMSRPTVDSLVHHVPQTNDLRLKQLKQTFSDLECKGASLHEQSVGESKNLVCTLVGNSHDTILFIAHYEHEGAGQSAIDNWSGAIMLPFLYHALTVTPREHTFVFAAVDGVAGAKALLASMRYADLDIKTVIALNALGLGPAQYYVNPTDAPQSAASSSNWGWMLRQLQQAAVDQRIDAPAASTPPGWLKIDDTREFRHRSIPSILIHSVSWDKRHLPGSALDTAEVIDTDAYFNTYTLLCYYSAELDQPQPLQNPQSSSLANRHVR